MAKEFNIHFDNRVLSLVDEFGDRFNYNFGFYFSYSSIDELSKVLDFFKSNKIIRNVFIKGKPAEVMLSEVSRFFKVINAAGGLVINSKGEFLLINRRGHWDLPKGKCDENESDEMTAIREVSEETGISGLQISRFLTNTYHTYNLNGQAVLKRTAWFEMLYKDNQPLIPQFQEDIVEAKWIGQDVLDGFLNKSYQTVREVFATSGTIKSPLLNATA